MIELTNYLGGTWQPVTGTPTILLDPVTGAQLAQAGAQSADMRASYSWARDHGGRALRSISYRQRAELLTNIVDTLRAHREKYLEISMLNSGTVRSDSAIDVDGAIHTIAYYAKIGGALPNSHHLVDGAPATLSRDGSFSSQHVLVPAQGLALLINAFNFPAWGLWEKAAPALLSGVPVIVKPATATAWLTHQMVRDVIEANILPPGALNIVCGRPAELLDALDPLDLVSFTGSAQTAASIRRHPRFHHDGVRLNAETDSVNSAILCPDADDQIIEALLSEVKRELTVKSGQKCTAIRRILVPASSYGEIAERLEAEFSGISVGDPRNPDVQMGSLASRAQKNGVQAGIRKLMQSSEVIFDGAHRITIQAPSDSACVAPMIFGIPNPDEHPDIHETEIFGPVASLMPYRDLPHAHALARQGMGSLVASLYGTDPAILMQASLQLAESHGRVHVISPEVLKTHTGHGNVMPQSNHGGPGRAGGGAELGGLRALMFFHRCAAIQGFQAHLATLAPP